MTHTTDQICKIFGCTPDALRGQYAANANTLTGMAKKATRTGKKVGNATAAELSGFAKKYKALAAPVKKVRTCKVTFALTAESYPTMPQMASDFKIGDTLVIIKNYWSNGEGHVRGYLNGTDVVVDVPDTWTDQV